MNGTLGGPIVRDKAWFFTALPALDPRSGGSLHLPTTWAPQPIDDNRIRNLSGKFTWQPHRRRPDRGDVAAELEAAFPPPGPARNRAVPDELARFQDQWADNYIGSYNRVIGDTTLLDLRFGKMTGVTPLHPVFGVLRNPGGRVSGRPPPAPRTTSRSLTRFGSKCSTPTGAASSGGPNHRNQFNGSLTYYLDTAGGSHNFKVGGQASRELRRVTHLQERRRLRNPGRRRPRRRSTSRGPRRPATLG